LAVAEGRINDDALGSAVTVNQQATRLCSICQPKTLDFGAEVMVDAKQAGKKESQRKKKMSFFPEERECEAIKRGQIGAPGSSQAQHTVTALQYGLPPDG